MLDVRANCSLASCTTQPFVSVFSVHAGQYCLRGGEAIRGVGRRERGLESRGKFFVGSTTGHHETRGHAGPARVPRVPRGSRGSHAGPTRVPRGSILHCAGPTHRLGF